MNNLKKLNRKLLNLMLIIGVFSCKKIDKNFGTTTYNGRVIERGSTVGISNCPVIIHGSESGGIWGSRNYPTIAETYSDSDGYYSLTFEAEEGKSYYIYPESRKHYGNSKGQAVWELKKFGKTVSKDLEQWALAFVKMKLLNRHRYKDYNFITFGSHLNGITLSPSSKDTITEVSVWGNMSDSVGFTYYQGKNQIRSKNFGFHLNAWQTDSITIEY